MTEVKGKSTPEEVKKARASFARSLGVKKGEADWAAKYDRVIDEFPFYDPGVALKYKKRVRLQNRRGRALRKAILRKDGTPNDITEEILASWDSFLGPESAAVIVIYGLLKTGKSRGTAIFCKHSELKVPEAITKVTTSVAEMNDAYACLPKHSTVVRDEDLEATGPGSRIEQIDLNNFQKLGREYEVNTIYNFKKYRNIEIANYYFEMFGWDPTTKQSRMLVRDELGDYMGFIVLDTNYDDDYYKQFQTKKSEVAQQMRDSKGHLSAFGSTDVTQIVNRVWDYCKEKGVIFKHGSEFISLIKDEPAFEDIANLSSKILEDVAGRLKYRASIEPKPEKKAHRESGVERSSEKFTVKTIKEYLDEASFDIVIEQLQDAGTPDLHIKVYKMSLSGMDYDTIGAQMGFTRGTVGNYIKPILDDGVGYAWERTYDILLTTAGRRHEMGGGNTGEIDCTCYDPLEVYSLKCLNVFRLNTATRKLNAYLQFAREHQCPIDRKSVV